MLLLLFRPFGDAAPPPVVVVLDRFVDDKKHDEKFRKRQQRLREQLEAAFDGQFGITAQEALAEFIAPQVTDSVARAPAERVDWNRVWQRYDEVVRKLEQLARERDDDDDESFLLLS